MPEGPQATMQKRNLRGPDALPRAVPASPWQHGGDTEPVRGVVGEHLLALGVYCASREVVPSLRQRQH
jgi:hypothetical protein